MMPGTTSASGAVTSKAKPFGNQWRKALIVYVFLIIAMSYLDRVNLSIAGPTVCLRDEAILGLAILPRQS